MEWPATLIDTIYLDHHATTPLDPAVKASMDAYLETGPGNPHSIGHAPGWRAREAIDEARRQVAALIGAKPEEIIFTSGATEANNLAILGSMAGEVEGGAGILTSAIEHPSVLEPCRHLARQGANLKILPVTPEGLVEPSTVDDRLDDQTRLLSIMAANHEIGTLQPVPAIARLCKSRGMLVHCDGAQAAGKMPLDVTELNCDLLSLSAHKLHGPMGIGALYVKAGTILSPLVHGGAQERGLRPGTVPAPLAVGFGEAARIARENLMEEGRRIRALRDKLLDRLQASIPGLRVNASLAQRLPGNLNLRVAGIDAEDWLLNCPGLALSTGAACASGRQEPSSVLAALGLDAEEIAASIRIGLGRFTRDDDIESAAEALVAGLPVRRTRGSG